MGETLYMLIEFAKQLGPGQGVSFGSFCRG